MLYNDIVLDKITVVGHHLEWIALLPESFDVPKETIQKAIVAVTEQIEQLPPAAKRSFETVLPCSHAAKALTSLIHQESFEVWQRLNQSEHDSDSLRKAAERNLIPNGIPHNPRPIFMYPRI